MYQEFHLFLIHKTIIIYLNILNTLFNDSISQININFIESLTILVIPGSQFRFTD